MNNKIVLIISIILLFQLVKLCERYDWLNNKPSNIEKKIDRDKIPERFEKLKRENLTN